jgi:uncharacterized protein YqjF (DUF2071 family)
VFIADWNDALFIHFRLDPDILAPAIPFELDLWEGSAYVSLVAFTQSRLRPTIGGKLGEWLSRPLGTHEFLNLRAYVRVNDQPGIYFIAEWIPNALATLIGPRLYGLPYRFGKLNYHHKNTSDLYGQIIAEDRNVFYRASIDSAEFAKSPPQTVDHFLLERYIAFTHHRGVSRRFEVAHEPWPQCRATIVLNDRKLIEPFVWMADAQIVAANFSPGVQNVQIGRPQRILQKCDDLSVAAR